MAADSLPALPRRLLGLGLVVAFVAFLGVCVAVYNKVYQPVVAVTMRIDAVDNTLLPQAEIRLRGVPVGEVRAISTDGEVATLDLALQPDQVRFIPSNVTAILIPRTLLGESIVALQPPPNPAPTPISEGDVITRDRSSQAVQLEQVLNDVLPLLQAVRPADLATTLGALTQALSGRGEQLGDTLVQLHNYLRQLNPALPDLSADVAELPEFTDTNAEALPDLIEALQDLTTTSQTLVERRDDFENLFTQLTDSSDDLEDFLQVNRENIIELVDVARPTLELLAKYSPEYVCFFRQLSDTVPLVDRIAKKGGDRPSIALTVELVQTRGQYQPGEEPEFEDKRGPRCYDQDVPQQQYPDNGRPLRDGSANPPARNQRGQGSTSAGLPSGPLPSGPVPSLPLLGGPPPGGPIAGGPIPGGTPPRGAPVPAFAPSIANSPPERQLVAGLVADMTGARSGTAPAWSSLLVGSLLRGAEVTVR